MTFDLLEKFGITYTDSNHRYERFGQQTLSVTSVLPYLQNDFLAAHPERIEKAGARGHGVARFIDEVESNATPSVLFSLNSRPPNDPLLGCANSFMKFKQETGFTALKSPVGDIASELFVYHDLLDYVGRLDLCGYAPNTSLKGPGLVEVKATAVLPKTVGPQSAAYFEAFNRCAKLYDLPKLKWRASLHLTAKGYRFLPLNDPLDWPRFTSALTTNRWAKELGYELEWKLIDKSMSPLGETAKPEDCFV